MFSFGVRIEALEDPLQPGWPNLKWDNRLRSAFLEELYGVFEDVHGGGGRIVTADQAPALSVRWKEFIKAHRAEIVAGKHWSLDDSDVTADLVPSDYHLSRPGKPDWPAK